MEDEDFGFAKRTDNVLKKILTVSNEQTHKDRVHNVEQLCSPPKVGFLLVYDRKNFYSIPLRTIIINVLRKSIGR